MSDQQSKLYWDPLRDDRWDLSFWAWRGAAGDTWYVIRRWCHGCRWLPLHPSPCLSPSFPMSLPLVCKNGSTVSSSQRTFISPHLCGLRRDDLGLQPSQPSCHLRKRGVGAAGWSEKTGRERRGWGRLSNPASKFRDRLMTDMFFLCLYM